MTDLEAYSHNSSLKQTAHSISDLLLYRCLHSTLTSPPSTSQMTDVQFTQAIRHYAGVFTTCLILSQFTATSVKFNLALRQGPLFEPPT